jgi:heme exporter protein C
MAFIKSFWWKILTIFLLFYVLIAGLLFEVPRLHILNETIRALYFHVPMWFGMIILLLVSMIYGIRYLATGEMQDDAKSLEFANTGILLGVLGILTGMIWAKYTWGSPWSSDPKQNAAAVGLLIYLAYKVLRNSIPDDQRRGRVSAVYNIFAFATLIPLLFILPRLTDSLHPGSGGNPGFNAYDLDSRMRLVFYPAVIGWTMFGVWLTTLRIRYRILKHKMEEIEYSS